MRCIVLFQVITGQIKTAVFHPFICYWFRGFIQIKKKTVYFNDVCIQT